MVPKKPVNTAKKTAKGIPITQSKAAIPPNTNEQMPITFNFFSIQVQNYYFLYALPTFQ